MTHESVGQPRSGTYWARVCVGVERADGQASGPERNRRGGPGAETGGEDSDTAAQSGRLSRRDPRTKARADQLLDRYLAVVELEESTRKAYFGYLDVHV